MFYQLIQRWRERDNPLFALLREVPLFHGLTWGELREVSRFLEIETFGPDSVVFVQGTPGQGAYVVISGSVDIVQTDLEDEVQMVLSHSEPGAFFGETALLDDTPRSASAVVKETAELAMLPRDGFLELAETRPHLGVKVALQLSQVIAERLRRTNRSLRSAREEVEAAGQEPEGGTL